MSGALCPSPALSIGASDFRSLREQDRLYVDKSAFIARVIDDPGAVILLPRPRRFGKTTNLSTLRYFLEKADEDRSALFADLAIWRETRLREHFRRYPVLWVTFKDVKKPTWDACFALTRELLGELYRQHHYLLDDELLTGDEAAIFREILAQRATQSHCELALRNLCRFLRRHHRQPVVILIDEYDTPIHAAFSAGYYDQAVDFFRTLLGAALKDNEDLFKGVLTGILRIAKESIFSGLNNLRVYSLLHPRYGDSFGFTEAEVTDLAARAGYRGELAELRDWYNGYLFGDTVIYNPWSILNALADGRCSVYWVNTGSNDLIDELLMRQGASPHEDIERLLRGEGIRKPIVENTVLRDVYLDEDAMWSFLLFCGYLKASELGREGVREIATLSIPNFEVREVFNNLFRTWLRRGLGGEREVEGLTRALLVGDTEAVEQRLGRLLTESASYFDTAGNAVAMPAEQVYHAFVLGLLVHLQPQFLVRSNRESGQGRFDVMIVPRSAGGPGVVLELKVKRKGETLKQALAKALKQIETQDYAAELRAVGASPIHKLAFAFDGKKVIAGALPGPRAGRVRSDSRPGSG